MKQMHLHTRNTVLPFFCYLLVSLALGPSQNCQAATLALSTGQSFVFNFDLFTLSRPTQAGDPTDGTLLGFGGTGWTVKTEFFQDSLSDAAMFTDVRSYFGDPAGIGFGVQFGYAPWPDFQGVVRVTSLNGTVQLQGMRCDEVVNGGYYTTGWIEPVPEPSVIGLGMVGLLGFCGALKHSRR